MNDGGGMTFWEHLDVLRGSLIRMLAAAVVAGVVAFVFKDELFGVVLAPSDSGFVTYRLLGAEPFSIQLINTGLTEQFMTHVKVAFVAGALIASPYILYVLFRFISPALYDNERKGVRFTFLFGTVMFYLGCLIGYSVVFPLTLRFLYTYEISSFVTNQLSLDSYMNNFLMLIFMMGIIFELPLVAMLMSKLGFLDRKFFSEYRRHAIVALMFVAAVITPSSDPFTLMAVFIPIYILWELSAFLVKPAPPEDDTEEEESEKEVETLK